MKGHMGLRDVLLDGDDVIIIRAALRKYLDDETDPEKRHLAEVSLHIFNQQDPEPEEGAP